MTKRNITTLPCDGRGCVKVHIVIATLRKRRHDESFEMRSTIEQAMRRVLHFYWRFARGRALGVLALVMYEQRGIFLVRPPCLRGWHLPGGGVEPGETLATALARELAEEGNIELTAPALLHGVFFNARASRRDHVACFVVQS